MPLLASAFAAFAGGDSISASAELLLPTVVETRLGDDGMEVDVS